MSDPKQHEEMQREDAYTLAHAFATARYRVDLGGDPVEFHVGERVPPIEEKLPAAHYAFITAWNPDAEHQDTSDNAESDDSLATRLQRLGVEFRRTWAQDAQGGHREAGWLIAGLDPDRADALGREFEQAGILVWARGEPVALHMLVARPEGDHREWPHVVWVE